MPQFPGFCGGSNTSQSLTADAEKSVNLFIEPTQSKYAKNPAGILVPTPGFTQWSTSVQDIGSRALKAANGRLFEVKGAGFYEYSATGIPTKWGTVAQDSNPAQIVFNGKVASQLGIASGGSVYGFDLTANAFTGPNFAGATATMLDYADGYGLLFDANTGRVFLSTLNNITAFSLGTFFQRSKFPDPWQTMFVDPSGLIWLVGLDTFEVWQNTGVGTQPWAPLSGLYGRVGIAAPFAFGISSAGMFWLARSAEGGANIVVTHGSIPQPVSTYAVSNAIAGYMRTTKISDAELLTYHDAGHTFANFSFPSAGRTWSLDAETKGWHERGQFNSAAGDYGLWAPRTHADCFGKHIVGDRTTGTLWTMDSTVTTDIDGTGIRRLRRTPGLTDEHKRHPISQFEILMDVGVAGQNLDPQVMLRISEDGGRTFGNELRASSGAVGKYRTRVKWSRLGAPADSVIECAWSDASPTRVVDAWVNNAEGMA